MLSANNIAQAVPQVKAKQASKRVFAPSLFQCFALIDPDLHQVNDWLLTLVLASLLVTYAQGLQIFSVLLSYPSERASQLKLDDGPRLPSGIPAYSPIKVSYWAFPPLCRQRLIF